MKLSNHTMEQVVLAFNNARSQEMYGLTYDKLSLDEKLKLEEYIRDYNHPVWKQVVIDDIKLPTEISNVGKLRNMYDKVEIIPKLDKDGYCCKTYHNRDNEKSYCLRFHRLVAQAFIPNPDNKPEVDHINAKKDFNWAGNLRWVTNFENIHYAIDMGLENHLLTRGEDKHNNVYSEKQIRQVCEMLMNIKNKISDIEKATGVPNASINAIRKGHQWTHISRNYDFPSLSFRGVKYSPVDIHTVCKLLEDPRNNPTKIAKMTGVSRDMVGNIRKKRCWQEISSQYNIPEFDYTGENAVQSVYDDATIEKVCQLLMDPYKQHAEIEKETGVTFDIISKIARGKYRKYIADKYNFPARRNPKSELIKNMHDAGKSNSEIHDALCEKGWNAPTRRRTLCQITEIIRNYERNK